MKFYLLIGLLWAFSPATTVLAAAHSHSIIKIGDFMPSFTLYNQDGKTITQKDLLGKIVVLNFIFTRCGVPTMCPASTKKMVELQKLVHDNRLSNNVSFVTISFDPIFDTPAILKKYAEAYKIDLSNYSFLTGDAEVIKNLTRLFGVYTISEKGTINHTMKTMVINKNGKVIYGACKIDWQPKTFLQIIKKNLQV